MDCGIGARRSGFMGGGVVAVDQKSLFRDEEGFTTVSMVLALLLTLALVFTGAQVYRIQSASAEVQEVADAAVLSAENQIAEFMVIARFCDAVVLSLSLTSIAAAGLGVAALCVPAAFPLSEGLLELTGNLVQARDSFGQKAAAVLNRLQEALPFFCAACAVAVAKANNAASENADYLAVALLVPSQGQAIAWEDADAAQGVLDDIEGDADDIRKRAQEAEDAARQADEAKERAFRRDCGDNPAYCMYERASHLASMEGSQNPLYSSVDAWSFSVALDRAKAYYPKRLASEAPEDESIAAQARSALRKNFYRFAVQQVESGYVRETDDGFDAYFPRLPRNTEQMRQTDLYTEAVYPVSTVAAEGDQGDGSEGGGTGKAAMHAWDGCPGASGATARGSIAQMEAGDFATCPLCEFKASSLGKVAAASAAIDNGFEFHYEAVADEAALYQEARERAQGPKDKVKGAVQGFLERLASLAGSFAGSRLDPQPPGRYGAIAFVVNAGSLAPAGGLGGAFVAGGGSLGPRAAISAATLVEEQSDEGRTVLNSLLDGLRQDGGAAVGAAGLVLDLWSHLLRAYGDAGASLAEGLKGTLDSMPLVGASGLGSWVSGKLKDSVRALGLQPAKLGAKKAVLVNSAYVAQRGAGGFASGFIGFKSRVVAAASGADDLFSAVMNDAEREALAHVQALGATIDIASIELLGPDGPSLHLTLPVPKAVREQSASAIQQLFDRLRGFRGSSSAAGVWR